MTIIYIDDGSSPIPDKEIHQLGLWLIEDIIQNCI